MVRRVATVYERKYSTGRVVYRVTLRRRSYPTFCLSFDDWNEACNWVEKNELEYFKNPDYFFKWREEQYNLMRRDKQVSANHLIRAKRKINT